MFPAAGRVAYLHPYRRHVLYRQPRSSEHLSRDHFVPGKYEGKHRGPMTDGYCNGKWALPAKIIELPGVAANESGCLDLSIVVAGYRWTVQTVLAVLPH